MGHKWGECRANAYNCNRDKPGDNKCRKPNDTVDGNVASCNVTNSSEITDATAKMAINDDLPCEDHGTFKCEIYVNEDLTITDHHLDVVSFTATQETKVKGDFSLSHSFTSLCDEVYSSGDSNITLKTFNDITQSLRLRSIGVMTVGSIQEVPNHKPLRVLFDTGSNKTMLNY